MRGEDFFEMLEGIDEDILEDAWKSGKRENKGSKKNIFFQPGSVCLIPRL